jgi:hypothetical protein
MKREIKAYYNILAASAFLTGIAAGIRLAIDLSISSFYRLNRLSEMLERTKRT